MEYMILALIKILDNMLSTARTIMVQKNRALVAAVIVTVNQIIFYKVINQVVNGGDSGMALYVASFGGGIGTYLVIKINSRISKDRMYIHTVMTDDKEEIILLRNFLMENKVTNVIADSYTKEWDKTLTATIYAETKHESRLIDKYLSDKDIKMKRIVYKE